MISKRRSILLFIFALLFLTAWAGTSYCHPRQVVEKTETSSPQEEAEAEKIVGAPQDIKQKTGIWVFIAWVWVSVLVLIYFLWLKIKEADRLYRLRFFSTKKD